MKSVNILIVEDEHIVAADIKKTLEQLGYSVVGITSSGEEAIRKAKKQHPDLVLMDVVLSGKVDGVTAAEAIQDQLGVPVVYLTAYADETTLQRAKIVEPFGYIVKPYDERELHAAIEIALCRHRAEKTIRESEERYHKLMENANDAIFMYDMVTGMIVDCNRKAGALIGMPSKKIKGLHQLQIHPQEEEKRYRELFKKIAIDGKYISDDIVIHRQNGERVPVESSFSEFVVDGQKLLLGIFRDISERKKAEEKLKRYTIRLESAREIDRAILAAMPLRDIAHAMITDIRGFVPCQLALVVVFDFEKEEARLIASQNEVDMKVSEGGSLSMKHFIPLDKLRRGEIKYIEKVDGKRKDPPELKCLGVTGIKSCIFAPLRIEGALIGTLVLGSTGPADFDEEHKSIALESADRIAVVVHQNMLRTELETGRQRLQTLVEQLPQGVLFLDNEQRILFANEKAREYLPVLGEAEVGKKIEGLGEVPFGEIVRRTSEGRWVEIELQLPEPRIFRVELRKLGEEDRPDAYIIVLGDMTHQREIENQLRQHERLAAVGQLAAGIAHDFNNMLQTIMMSAELIMRDKKFPGHLTQKLKNIVQQGERAALLIKQILDFSRKSISTRQPFNLTSFIREVVKILRRTIPETITIISEIESGEMAVNADATQIQQVIINLAVNARDAMSGSGELRIGLCRATKGGELRWPSAGLKRGKWICITVADTGSSIPPEIQPRIFDPFFTTKELWRGSGLGLAQVYGIVQDHGGHITFTSEAGKGTTFFVFLPQLEKSSPDAGETEGIADLPRGSGEWILVAEDDPFALEIATESLKYLGYRVITARNGQEALLKYDRHRSKISLILADVVMPEMGAIELYKHLKEKGEKLKIILVSGYPFGDLQNMGISDVKAWINKPLSIVKLASVIRKVLEE